MKQLTTIFAATLIISSCSNDKTTTTVTNTIDSTKTETPKSNLKEELPPLKTCSSNIGKLNTDGNGSIGSKTEMTELSKLLKNKDCDIIEIVLIQKSPPDRNYEDMALKIIYNRVSHSLKSIFTKTNVIEEYTNIYDKCLVDYLKTKPKSFYGLGDFCKDSKYDFNNREMKQTAVGTKPEQSEFDGSVKIVKDYIKSKAKDASSIDFLEWSKVSQLGDKWIVRCKYKGTNSFGAVVTENYWFYIQDNKVVDSKSLQ